MLLEENPTEAELEMNEYEKSSRSVIDKIQQESKEEVDIDAYKPSVQNRVWYISETDLSWITIGCVSKFSFLFFSL